MLDPRYLPPASGAFFRRNNVEENLDEIVINGETYVKKSVVSQDSEIKIIVCDKGFVFVGRFKNSEKDDLLLIKGAFVRRWGTSKGLGELAEKGPLQNTKLDEVSSVELNPKNILFSISCGSQWNDKYN